MTSKAGGLFHEAAETNWEKRRLPRPAMTISISGMMPRWWMVTSCPSPSFLLGRTRNMRTSRGRDISWCVEAPLAAQALSVILSRGLSPSQQPWIKHASIVACVTPAAKTPLMGDPFIKLSSQLGDHKLLSLVLQRCDSQLDVPLAASTRGHGGGGGMS